MSDLKLFKLVNGAANPLASSQASLERDLQTLFEKNLEALLGVRLLASEFVVEGGRMDTLGLDENGSPVVIEYKRSSNENVINQGLFYLDWLVSHRRDFDWLVMEKFGKEEVANIDWSGPRLICIAADFSRYDENAVRQMNRNIDLLRYKQFGDGLLLIEQLTTTTAEPASAAKAPAGGGQWEKGKYKTVSDYMAEAPPSLLSLYEALRDYLEAQGDDVSVRTTAYYIAFRRLRNYITVEFRNQLEKLLVYAVVDPSTVKLEDGFTRDVTKTGHFGSGDLEITLTSLDDLDRAKHLLDRAYGET